MGKKPRSRRNKKLVENRDQIRARMENERARIMGSILGMHSDRPTQNTGRMIWEQKLKIEGKFNEAHQQAMATLKEMKARRAAGEVVNALWSHIWLEKIKETGYSKPAALEWWKGFLAGTCELERAQWTEQVLKDVGEMEHRRGRDKVGKKTGDWRRDDLPDDIAWVGSRTCLMDDRQNQSPLPPLTEDDFFECPSPQARVLLWVAYKNPVKFMGEMMGIQKQQWGKQKPEVPIETKAAVAERVVEKQIEAPVPPSLEPSEVAKLVEKMLQGAQ